MVATSTAGYAKMFTSSARNTYNVACENVSSLSSVWLQRTLFISTKWAHPHRKNSVSTSCWPRNRQISCFSKLWLGSTRLFSLIYPIIFAFLNQPTLMRIHALEASDPNIIHVVRLNWSIAIQLQASGASIKHLTSTMTLLLYLNLFKSALSSDKTSKTSVYKPSYEKCW